MWGLRQPPSVPTCNRDAELPPIPLRRYYGLKLKTKTSGCLTHWNERIHLIVDLWQLPLHQCATEIQNTEFQPFGCIRMTMTSFPDFGGRGLRSRERRRNDSSGQYLRFSTKNFTFQRRMGRPKRLAYSADLHSVDFSASSFPYDVHGMTPSQGVRTKAKNLPFIVVAHAQ